MNTNIEKIKEIIKTKIRPMLVMDGGNIEFVDYKKGVVSVKLLGNCRGCPLSAITLKNTGEGMLKEEIPEIVSVEALDFEEDL